LQAILDDGQAIKGELSPIASLDATNALCQILSSQPLRAKEASGSNLFNGYQVIEHEYDAIVVGAGQSIVAS
jgi:hypothetical protein